jgi:CSLREA domain-containing protein
VKPTISASPARTSTFSILRFVFLTALLVYLASTSSTAMAATFTVNNTADSVDASPGNGICADSLSRCTLRAAIMETNALAGADVINLPSGTYTLTLVPGAEGNFQGNQTRRDLDILDNLTINGSGAASTIVQAGTVAFSGIDRVFQMNPNGDRTLTVTLDGITIRNGNRTGGIGGGIFFDGFNFTNTTYGGTLNINNCTISDNQAAFDGGGINVQDGFLNISNSTITNNRTVDGDGGGVFFRTGGSGVVTITNSTITNNSANATSTDANGNLFFGYDGGVSAPQNQFIDGGGNTLSPNFSANSRPPTANAGPDQTAECGSPVTLDGSASIDPEGGPLTFVWKEGATQIATGVMPSVTLGSGSHTITLTVTDDHNKTSTDTVIVTVADTQPPTITVNGADPMTIECHTTFVDPGATANDACTGNVPVIASGSVNADVPGTYTITYTAGSGPQTVTATRTVNVVDTQPPTITVNGANPMTVSCQGSFTDPGATASDACAGSVPVTTSGTVNVSVPGTYTITYSATDGINPAVTATRTVIVQNVAPVITLNGADPMTVECHTTFVDPGATANDPCAGSVPVTASGNVNANTPGTYTITYTAGSATKTRTVNVVDTQAPTLTLNGADPMTVECHTSFTDPGATASDACAGDLTSAITVSGSVNPNAVGTYTLTYSVTDGTHPVTRTRTVNVVDTQAPTITLNGADPMTVECHTTFVDPGATADDACAGSLTVTTSGSVNANAVGTYTITYSATDGTHPVSKTRTVHVVDTIPAVITLNGADPMTVECHTSFTDPGATANDGCAGNLTSSIVVSGSVNPNAVGPYTLTYTVSDGSNTTTRTRVVNVVDTIAPTLTLNGANPMTVECHTTFVDPGATANDGCAGNLTSSIVVTSTPNPNVPGQYTYTYTVSDGYNTTTATRMVNVVDTTAPTITLNGQSITLWPPDHQYVTVNVADLVASATDSCDSAVDISDVFISKVTSDEVENGNGDGNTLHDIIIGGNCKSVQLRSERNGSSDGRVYTITFKVSDAAGNVTTATALVTVPKDQSANGGAVDSGVHYTVTSSCP